MSHLVGVLLIALIPPVFCALVLAFSELMAYRRDWKMIFEAFVSGALTGIMIDALITILVVIATSAAMMLRS